MALLDTVPIPFKPWWHISTALLVEDDVLEFGQVEKEVEI